MTKHPVGAKLFHANRWIDIMKLMVVFHNFVNAHKKVYRLPPTNSWINHVTVEVLHILINLVCSETCRNVLHAQNRS
jgi:hypothetical protein